MAAPRRGVDLEAAARLKETSECDPCDTPYHGRAWLIRVVDHEGQYVEWSVGSFWCAVVGLLRCFGRWNDAGFLISAIHTLAARLEDLSNQVLASMAGLPDEPGEDGEPEDILKGGLK